MSKFDGLVDELDSFLASNHGAACMDDDEDRRRVAEGAVDWLTRSKGVMSAHGLLPKAEYFLSFDVVDEATGERIVRLTLDKTWDMAGGDFLSLQNFFWSTIGRAIKKDRELRERLESGGVRVETEFFDTPKFA